MTPRTDAISTFAIDAPLVPFRPGQNAVAPIVEGLDAPDDLSKGTPEVKMLVKHAACSRTVRLIVSADLTEGLGNVPGSLDLYAAIFIQH